MARYAIPGVGRDHIDAIVQRWEQNCLLKEGSLLFDDRVVWSEANLADFRRRFLENPLHGKQTFFEKIALQLEDASEEVRILAGEMLAVYLLVVWQLMGSETKVEAVEAVARPLELASSPHWSELVAALIKESLIPGPATTSREMFRFAICSIS